MPVPESQVIDLLQAISETLDPPYPASGFYEQRDHLVTERAAWLSGYLDGFDSTSAQNMPAHTRGIRKYATRPLPYEPEGGEAK